MRVNNTKTVLTVACFVATLSTPVFGLDAKDFMTKFTQAFEHRYSIKIAHGAVTSENDGKRANGKPNISLNTKDVTLTPDNGLIDEILGIKQKAPIDIVFQGVQENADGSYSVDAIVPDPPTFTSGDASFSGSVFVMKNAHIPAKSGYDVFGNTLHVDKTTISMGSVTYKGKKFTAFDALYFNSKRDDARETTSTLFNVSELSEDLSQLEDVASDLTAKNESARPVFNIEQHFHRTALETSIPGYTNSPH